MPLPGSVFTSSAGGDIGGGRPYTAFRGPVIIGTQFDGSTGGPLMQPVGLIPIQSTQPTTNLVTTAAATVSRATFMYIPQTTQAIATSSFAAGDSPPPFAGAAALLWDAGNRRLMIYSTASGSGTWFGTNVGVTTSAGAGGFTSS